MTSRFLIEVPHEATMIACARAVQTLMQTGSHFLTHADWGCKDGEHKAWIIVEVGSKDEARGILPPALRSQAKVVQLNTFSLADMEQMMRQHQG